MEAKKPKRNDFSAISINRIVASRFREYSKEVSPSHTETLDSMMDFFEKARITPKSEVMISFIQFQRYMMGRFDYIEELLREQERKYHKPIYKMLRSLFEGKPYRFPEDEQPLLIEEKTERLSAEEWRFKENVVPRQEYNQLWNKKEEFRRSAINLIDRLTLVKPAFGKPYYRLEMDSVGMERLERKLRSIE